MSVSKTKSNNNKNVQVVVFTEKYYKKQLQLLDFSEILTVRGGRTKTSTGSYSSTPGDIYDYLLVADLVEKLMLTENEAELLLQTFKLISRDKVALPSSYKAIKARVMPALKDRFQKNLRVTLLLVRV